MSPLGRPPVFIDIVEEHFDELDFLWEQREANVYTPDWTLRQLAEHEERVEAHLDGLRVAELHAIDLARERIGDGTSAAAAATFVLWEAGEPEYLDLVFSHLGGDDVAITDGVRSALRHGDVKRMKAPLLQLVTGTATAPAAAAADVLAFHRQPVAPLEQLMRSAGPWERTLALGAAGRLRRLRDQDLAEALEHPEPAVRLAAMQAGARAAIPGLAARCRSAASRGTDPDADALAFLGVLGEPQDLALMQKAVARKDLAEAALRGVGAMGNVQAIPSLIELMADKALGVFATAAYRRITGATNVEGERPFPPPPVAEGEDEEEALPPDPAKAADDWRKRSNAMPADQAWQAGLAVNETVLANGFDRLPLESRRDVYLRLCHRSEGGVPDLELEALAIRQRRN